MPRKLFEFVSEKNVIGGEHLPPTPYNLRLFEFAGIEKITLLVRDPRDALISWWRHLERPDIKSKEWHAASLVASGFQSENYYQLNEVSKLADLIKLMYPAMQSWLLQWADVRQNDSRFSFYVFRFEDMVADPEDAFRKLFGFFGHDVTPVLPPKRTDDEYIDVSTHFRRGVVGSFRDEGPDSLMASLQDQFDPRLTEYFGWVK